jgi:hypothetical protein
VLSEMGDPVPPESTLLHIAGKPEQLDFDSPTASQQWQDWKDAWESYALAAGVDDMKSKKQQTGVFLWTLNKKAMNIWKTFTWAADEDKYELPLVIEKFDQFLRPKKNVICERNKFWTMKARPGATFEQMLADVRTQIGVCEFENVTVDELARDKLITLISDNSLRKTLLKKADLKLDELIAEARSFYSARTHLAECDGTKEQVKVNEVRSAPRAGPSQSAKTCTRCGYSHAPRSFPAEGKECHTCGGEDHFSQCCPNDTMSEAPRGSRPRGRSWRGRGRAARANNGKVHQTMADFDAADASNYDVSGDEPYVYVVNNGDHLQPEDTVTLQIGQSDIFLRFQVDTGADVNVLSMHKYVAATGDTRLRDVWRHLCAD